jgi:hypothetical protein
LCTDCYTTGMFALPNLMSHVSSAAFAQGRLSFGSGLLRPAHLTLSIRLLETT